MSEIPAELWSQEYDHYKNVEQADWELEDSE